jgi:hypothetical protein
MTASPGREVDGNLLRGAALGSAQPRTNAQDAGCQDLGDLVEPLSGCHQIGTEGLGHAGGRCALGTDPRTVATDQVTSTSKSGTNVVERSQA